MYSSIYILYIPGMRMEPLVFQGRWNSAIPARVAGMMYKYMMDETYVTAT